MRLFFKLFNIVVMGQISFSVYQLVEKNIPILKSSYLLGFMCVPYVRVTGGKGKRVDYGASAWKGVFCRHLCGTGQPFALGVASFCSPFIRTMEYMRFYVTIIILHAPPKPKTFNFIYFFS